MGLFSSRKSYFGVDVGGSTVKMVELVSHGGRARLLTYGYVEANTDIVHGSDSDEKNLIEIIKRLHAKAEISTTRCVVALPNFSVFSSIISLPNMSKKELNKAVTWEAKKFIPLPIEEMVLDWRPLTPAEEKAQSAQNIKNNSENTGDSKTKQQRILITAAPKELVERYIRVFKSAEFELVAMETEGFALERSLIGKDPGVVMIVDLGATSTDISLVEAGIPILNRSIDVGGITITQAIGKNLNIDMKRAEQFKRDIGFSSTVMTSIPRVIETTLSPIVNEIKYSFDLFQGRHHGGVVEKIVLTGGSSVLPGLNDYLKNILQIKVYVGDPWARVMYPVELKPALQELAPRFSVAVGLAMREIL